MREEIWGSGHGRRSGRGGWMDRENENGETRLGVRIEKGKRQE